MNQSKVVDVSELIDQQKVTRFQIWVVWSARFPPSLTASMRWQSGMLPP